MFPVVKKDVDLVMELNDKQPKPTKSTICLGQCKWPASVKKIKACKSSKGDCLACAEFWLLAQKIALDAEERSLAERKTMRKPTFLGKRNIEEDGVEVAVGDQTGSIIFLCDSPHNTANQPAQKKRVRGCALSLREACNSHPLKVPG